MQDASSGKRRLLWLNSERGRAILLVRAKILEATRNWFKERGYLEVHGPTLIPWGDSSCFEVPYYERKAFLAHGLQSYALAIIPNFGKIYTIAPSFRVEKRETTRHLTEYWRIEAEKAGCDLQGIMKVQEELLVYICKILTKTTSEILSKLGQDVENLSAIKYPFPRVTYDEAIKILKGDDINIEWGEDFNLQQEMCLTNHFDQLFFVTHYPMGVQRLFYKGHPQRPELTLSADLLVPGYGEVASATEMIEFQELFRRMQEEKNKPEDYQFYLDLERYGTRPPCSGFALGVERIMMWICNLANIENTIAFPRTRNRFYP